MTHNFYQTNTQYNVEYAFSKTWLWNYIINFEAVCSYTEIKQAFSASSDSFLCSLCLMFSNMKGGKLPVSLWSGNISICRPRGPALVSVQLYRDRSFLWLWGKSPRLFCVNPLKSYSAIVLYCVSALPCSPQRVQATLFLSSCEKGQFNNTEQ